MSQFSLQKRPKVEKPAPGFCVCQRCQVVYKEPEQCGSFVAYGFENNPEPFFPHETFCEKCRLDLILFLFSKLFRAKNYLALTKEEFLRTE